MPHLHRCNVLGTTTSGDGFCQAGGGVTTMPGCCIRVFWTKVSPGLCRAGTSTDGEGAWVGAVVVATMPHGMREALALMEGRSVAPSGSRAGRTVRCWAPPKGQRNPSVVGDGPAAGGLLLPTPFRGITPPTNGSLFLGGGDMLQKSLRPRMSTSSPVCSSDLRAPTSGRRFSPGGGGSFSGAF